MIPIGLMVALQHFQGRPPHTISPIDLKLNTPVLLNVFYKKASWTSKVCLLDFPPCWIVWKTHFWHLLLNSTSDCYQTFCGSLLEQDHLKLSKACWYLMSFLRYWPMNFKGAWLGTSIELTPQLLGPSSRNWQNMFIGVPETFPESFVQIDH